MKTLKLIVFLISIIVLNACNEKEKDKKKRIAFYKKNIETENSNCLAPSDWFKLVDGVRKTKAPNEGSLSVFANNETVTNCDFHQWSWQKFLWLTNENNGRPMFLDSLNQVSSIGEKIEKNSVVILTDTAQASSSTDILKTPNFISGKPVPTTVYYAIYMDAISYETMIKYAPMAIKNPESIKNIAFPVGALELKTSWVDINALKDSSSYFITDALINGVPKKVALLGMYVVGVVENHPEFIWATFEHDALAPYYDWSKATTTLDAPITSDIDYPFFSKNSTVTVKNIISGNDIYTDIFSVYKYGTPVEIKKIDNENVQVYMETSQNGSQNYNNIRKINKSVKKQLTGVWNNYFYNGSLWIDTEGYIGLEAQTALLDSLGGNLNNSKKGDLARGSVAAYNITMETYVQVGFSSDGIHKTKNSDLVNCFLCHSVSHDNRTTPLNISLIFTGYIDHLNGFNKTEIKQKHVELVRTKLAALSSNKN